MMGLQNEGKWQNKGESEAADVEGTDKIMYIDKTRRWCYLDE